MNTFEQAIGAGETISFPAGRQFLLLTTSSAVDVRFFNPKNNPSEFAQGVEAGFKATFDERFLKVEISSVSAQTVKVGISDIADCSYDRSVGDVDADVIPGANLYDSTPITVAAGAYANVASGSSARRYLLIQADINNVGPVHINGSGVVNRGVPLYPGETLSLDTTDSVLAYNGNAIAVMVRYLVVES